MIEFTLAALGAMSALGLSPGDFAYRCSVQTTTPSYDRLENILVSTEGDEWRFDPRLAAVIGVSRARGTIGTDARTKLEAAIPGRANAVFRARVDVADEKADRYVIDWDVRGSDPEIDSEALLNSGLAICDFGPVQSDTGSGV